MQKSKKAVELSFTFIFSIILIAVFIFVAVWAIRHFLELKDRTQIQIAINDIETTIQEIWQAEEAQKTESFFLPSSVTSICFANFSQATQQSNNENNELNKYQTIKNKNLFILPFTVKAKYDIEGAYMAKCGNINCVNFTNPTCFENKNGKITIKFVGLPDGRVKVERP